MIRLLSSIVIAVALLVPAAWLGGFNFDYRGEGAFLLYIVFLGLIVAAWTYPGWSDWEARRRSRPSGSKE